MSSAIVDSLRTALSFLRPQLMWTGNGVFFGYRRADSLFTCDGVEVGRFSGAEIFGPNGHYLGELSGVGERLVTSSYKKSQRREAFIPKIERGHVRLTNQMALPRYCGYEEFPEPEVLKAFVLKQRKPPRSFANANGGNCPDRR